MGCRTVLNKIKYYVILSIIFFSPTLIAKPHYATIVMEFPSRTVLYSENPTVQNQPASLTKVMTLYLVFKALDNGTLKIDQPLHVSAHAANMQPSKLGLRANDTITVEEAIEGLVTKSANDAASVLAENLASSENDFADQMTAEAAHLGMVNTTFKNASGIANNLQLTTAYDMAILGASILRDYPHYYHYFSLREFNFRNRVIKTHNHLLGKYPGCDGIKTGYTTPSGFNLLSSATRNGRRLVAVVLGGNSIKSRDLRMMQLLDLGFSKLPPAPNNPLPPATTPAIVPTTTTPATLPAPSQATPVSPVLNPPQKTSSLEPDLEQPETTIEEEF